MPNIDNLISEVIKSNASADDKTKIIQALIAATPADRWGVNRYVIWGLIVVVVLTVIGLVIAWGSGGDPTKVPAGLIALGTTALGALAAYLVPPSHPAATTPGPAPAPSPGAAPVVTAINPQNGDVGGGTPVTVTGSGFTGATSVRFGATSASGVRVVSDTQITATSPAGSGTVHVTVVTPAGTSAASPADQFTYN